MPPYISGLLGGLVIMLVSAFMFFLDYRMYGDKKPFKKWIIREMFKNPFGALQFWVFQKNTLFLIGFLLFVLSVLVALGIGKGSITVQ